MYKLNYLDLVILLLLIHLFFLWYCNCVVSNVCYGFFFPPFGSTVRKIMQNLFQHDRNASCVELVHKLYRKILSVDHWKQNQKNKQKQTNKKNIWNQSLVFVIKFQHFQVILINDWGKVIFRQRDSTIRSIINNFRGKQKIKNTNIDNKNKRSSLSNSIKKKNNNNVEYSRLSLNEWTCTVNEKEITEVNDERTDKQPNNKKLYQPKSKLNVMLDGFFDIDIWCEATKSIIAENKSQSLNENVWKSAEQPIRLQYKLKSFRYLLQILPIVCGAPT